MKKFLTDNFGYTLKNIRENLKLTQTAVFQGILTRSTWSSYESGNMIPDMITFITLLERMGISPDRFEFIVSEEVHRFFKWYDECLFYIENNCWNELIEKRKEFKILKQINIKIQFQYRDFIDYVIERYVNKNMDRALYHINLAIANTVKDMFVSSTRWQISLPFSFIIVFLFFCITNKPRLCTEQMFFL